jgi:hypothetical protein
MWMILGIILKIEGMTPGPTLPDGHQILIFVTDNNFDRTEITKFLIFEIQ